MSGFRLRYFVPVVLVALCLVTLCTFTAISLFQQQAAVTQVLRENVDSRRAAVELRECLTDLVALENDRVERVSVLHNRVRVLLQGVGEAADQSEEQDLHNRLRTAFSKYLSYWQAMPPLGDPRHEASRSEATNYLENEVKRPCEAFILYNGHRIEISVENHERVLRQLAWGMAVVGGLGGVAGVVLGFGVARGLSRSIRRLRVQIRDAAGKLDPDIPEIILMGEGDFQGLHTELDLLTGRIEQVVGTLQQREREVLRAEHLAAVGQLAAGIGHEIRNPLTAIKMFVQAGLEIGGDELTTSDLRVIEGEVRRMEQSLQTFLDFARPAKSERRPTELDSMIRSVIALIRGRAEKQLVSVEYAGPTAVIVTADSEQLRQVIVNLCLNALDAMPGGGALSVYVRETPGNRIEIEIADTGPGVSDAILPRLFEPFVSSKDTGLGLGLVISKRIIENHLGHIATINRRGGGASFFVNLPAGRQRIVHES